MQDIGWSRVGAQGKHKHAPLQQDRRASPRHNPNHSTQAKQAESSKEILYGAQLSLVALPATALASIFYHLDILDAFNLAQTCHACATELAHQKADFARRACKELAPAVSRHSPGGPWPDRYGQMTTDQPYGADTHPVRLVLKWGTEPGSALRRLYALSQQPAFTSLVSEVWRHAWPKTLWSDLL